MGGSQPASVAVVCPAPPLARTCFGFRVSGSRIRFWVPGSGFRILFWVAPHTPSTSALCQSVWAHRFGAPGLEYGWLTRVDGEVSRGEKMLYSRTDTESYITEYTLVYEDEHTADSVTRACVECAGCVSVSLFWPGFGFRVSGFGFRDPGFGYRADRSPGGASPSCSDPSPSCGRSASPT